MRNYQLIRKYIQFNELVIDNFDMLVSAERGISTKTETHPYSFGHGSYAPFKQRHQLVEEQTLTMTIELNTRKLKCSNQKFYKDFVLKNLLMPGKLWAIEGNQLLWTNAFVSNISEPYELYRYTLSLDLDFVLYDGIWHKADSRKTFLQPYNPCEFDECLDYQEIDECIDCCINCLKPVGGTCVKCSCECEFLQAEYSLCELKMDVAENFYKQCGESYKIIYNCEAGDRIWGEEKMRGTRICKEDSCTNIIAGQFYSDTVLDSENVTVTIIGTVIDPVITINGNSMQILGEYCGYLIITSNGDIYHQQDDCCLPELVPVENMIIPDGSTFGFLVHQGMNSVVVDTNECCSMVCIYIKVGSITI